MLPAPLIVDYFCCVRLWRRIPDFATVTKSPCPPVLLIFSNTLHSSRTDLILTSDPAFELCLVVFYVRARDNSHHNSGLVRGWCLNYGCSIIQLSLSFRCPSFTMPKSQVSMPIFFSAALISFDTSRCFLRGFSSGHHAKLVALESLSYFAASV